MAKQSDPWRRQAEQGGRRKKWCSSKDTPETALKDSGPASFAGTVSRHPKNSGHRFGVSRRTFQPINGLVGGVGFGSMRQDIQIVLVLLARLIRTVELLEAYRQPVGSDRIVIFVL